MNCILPRTGGGGAGLSLSSRGRSREWLCTPFMKQNCNSYFVGTWDKKKKGFTTKNVWRSRAWIGTHALHPLPEILQLHPQFFLRCACVTPIQRKDVATRTQFVFVCRNLPPSTWASKGLLYTCRFVRPKKTKVCP